MRKIPRFEDSTLGVVIPVLLLAGAALLGYTGRHERMGLR